MNIVFPFYHIDGLDKRTMHLYVVKVNMWNELWRSTSKVFFHSVFNFSPKSTTRIIGNPLFAWCMKIKPDTILITPTRRASIFILRRPVVQHKYSNHS